MDLKIFVKFNGYKDKEVEEVKQIRELLIFTILILCLVLTGPVYAMEEDSVLQTASEEAVEESESLPAADIDENAISQEPSVTYQVHVENRGTMAAVIGPATAGTSGESLRMEALWIEAQLGNRTIPISYSAHVENIGWMSPVSNGQMAGTEGQSLRVEAFNLKITDSTLSSQYDIYYRVHAQDYGWLDWAKNGENAGTAGLSKRLEAIQIVILSKGQGAPGSTNRPYVTIKSFGNIVYRTHVENIGWQDWKADGQTSGTSGQSLRLEAIQIQTGENIDGGIEYQTHIQNLGWESGWRSNEQISGTSGRALRLEAIRIRLTGNASNQYDIYYRVHCENFGWLGWASNGSDAGSADYGYRLEAIEIRLVPKGGSAPGSTANAFKQGISLADFKARIKGGWMNRATAYKNYDRPHVVLVSDNYFCMGRVYTDGGFEGYYSVLNKSPNGGTIQVNDYYYGQTYIVYFDFTNRTGSSLGVHVNSFNDDFQLGSTSDGVNYGFSGLSWINSGRTMWFSVKSGPQ